MINLGQVADQRTRTVIVVGAGLAGVTAAYALAERGLSVTLLDSAPSAALGASFANAGMITPSMSDPWNSPGILGELIKGIVTGHSPLKFAPLPLLQSWRWGLTFLHNSSEERFDQTQRNNFALAEFSRRKLSDLKERLDLPFAHDCNGSLKLFRDRGAMKSAVTLASKLQDQGLRYEVLDAKAAIEREPVLNRSRDTIAGALYFPEDEIGDARQFTRGMCEKFVQIGGKTRFGTRVQHIANNNGRVTGIQTQSEFLPADIVVVAAGCASKAMLESCEERLLIEPVKGYSLSFTLPNVELPRHPIVDTSLHTVVSRIGDQLRVAGIAEVAGHDRRAKPKRTSDLLRALLALYPGHEEHLSLDAAEQWAGLRPVSADGLPYIGPAKVRGLYANTGHGHLGWTMAVGSSDLLCAQIFNEEHEIDASPYALNRHG